MLVVELNRIVRMIPPHYMDLFECHIKNTLELCNQGCFILTWSSLNIGKPIKNSSNSYVKLNLIKSLRSLLLKDSFLKTVENGLRRLEGLVQVVVNAKEKQIFEILN